jgi:hypothetical protein
MRGVELERREIHAPHPPLTSAALARRVGSRLPLPPGEGGQMSDINQFPIRQFPGMRPRRSRVEHFA